MNETVGCEIRVDRRHERPIDMKYKQYEDLMTTHRPYPKSLIPLQESEVAGNLVDEVVVTMSLKATDHEIRTLELEGELEGQGKRITVYEEEVSVEIDDSPPWTAVYKESELVSGEIPMLAVPYGMADWPEKLKRAESLRLRISIDGERALRWANVVDGDVIEYMEKEPLFQISRLICTLASFLEMGHCLRRLEVKVDNMPVDAPSVFRQLGRIGWIASLDLYGFEDDVERHVRHRMLSAPSNRVTRLSPTRFAPEVPPKSPSSSEEDTPDPPPRLPWHKRVASEVLRPCSRDIMAKWWRVLDEVHAYHKLVPFVRGNEDTEDIPRLVDANSKPWPEDMNTVEYRAITVDYAISIGIFDDYQEEQVDDHLPNIMKNLEAFDSKLAETTLTGEEALRCLKAYQAAKEARVAAWAWFTGRRDKRKRANW